MASGDRLRDFWQAGKSNHVVAKLRVAGREMRDRRLRHVLVAGTLQRHFLGGQMASRPRSLRRHGPSNGDGHQY